MTMHCGHPPSHSQSHTHTHTLTLAHSHSQSHAHTHTLTLAHSHTRTLTLTLTPTLTHTGRSQRSWGAGREGLPEERPPSIWLEGDGRAGLAPGRRAVVEAEGEPGAPGPCPGGRQDPQDGAGPAALLRAHSLAPGRAGCGGLSTAPSCGRPSPGFSGSPLLPCPAGQPSRVQGSSPGSPAGCTG